MSVSHQFVSAIPDGADATLVRPSNWNAGHLVNIDLATEVHGVLPTANGGKPTGEAWIWAGAIADIPVGALFCNGAAVSRTTYAALFAAIKTIHGAGNGTTTFNLPDYRDRVIAGASVDSSGIPKTSFSSALLQSGGINCHSHGVCDPGHNHGYSGITSDHTHNYSGTTDSHQHNYSGSTFGHTHNYSGTTNTSGCSTCADSTINNVFPADNNHCHSYSGTTDSANDSFSGSTDRASVNYSGTTGSANASYSGNTNTEFTCVTVQGVSTVPPFYAGVYVIQT